MKEIIFRKILYLAGATASTFNSLPGAQKGGLANSSELNTILQIVFGVLGALAALSIVISGINYIVSNGDPQKVNKAKNGILYSLIGLAVAILAEAIVAFVINKT